MVKRESSFLDASSRSRLDSYFRQNSRQASKLRTFQMPLGRWHLKTLLLATGCLLLVINYFHSLRMDAGARRQWRRFVINPAKPYKSLPYSRRRHSKSQKDGGSSSNVQIKKAQVPSSLHNKTKSGKLKKGTSLAIGQLPKPKIQAVKNTSLLTQISKSKKGTRVGNKTMETALQSQTEKRTKSPQVQKPSRRQNTTSDKNSASSEGGNQNIKSVDKLNGSSLIIKLPSEKTVTRNKTIETSVLGLKELIASGLHSSSQILEAPVKAHEDIKLETKDKQPLRPLVADMRLQSLNNVVGPTKDKTAILKSQVENKGLQVPGSLPVNMQPESLKNGNAVLNITSESNNLKVEVQAPLLSKSYSNLLVPENEALKMQPQGKDGQSPQLQGHDTQLQSLKNAIPRDTNLNLKSEVKSDLQTPQPAADDKPGKSLKSNIPEDKNLGWQIPLVPADSIIQS